MYVSDFRPNDEKVAVMLLVAVVCLVVAFSGGYLLGFRTHVPDNGTGADATGVELKPIIVHQHEITDGLNQAVAGSGAAAATADHIAVTAGEAAAAVGDAGKLIDECQQIVGRVRNRGKK